jgi:hypothetical protein
MSVDSQTGVAVVAGATTGGVALLANTGLPIYVPIVVGVATVAAVALLVRFSQRG